MGFLCYYVRNDVRSAKDGRFSRGSVGDRLEPSSAICVCAVVDINRDYGSSCRSRKRTPSTLVPEHAVPTHTLYGLHNDDTVRSRTSQR
jgi:hypothetical protein